MGTVSDNVYRLLHRTVGSNIITEGFRFHRGNEQTDVEVLMTPFQMEVCRAIANDGLSFFRHYLEETYPAFCAALPAAEPRRTNVFETLRLIALD